MLIRDPIHGDIALGPLEAAVLDCAAVQRLRGIKQLGTASLVYPGAVHTRFDHSLGASAVSHRIVAALRREGVEVPRELEDLVAVGALLRVTRAVRPILGIGAAVRGTIKARLAAAPAASSARAWATRCAGRRRRSAWRPTRPNPSWTRT